MWRAPRPTPLRRSIAARESATARDLTDARGFGLPYQEETVTEQLLLALARDPVARRVLQARAFTKAEESRVGADWLWDISGRGGGRFFLRVQAKVLTSKGEYGVGQSAAKTMRAAEATRLRRRLARIKLTQRRVLIRSSAADKVPAVYAFYNDVAGQAHSRTCWWEPVLGPLGGITLASARDVDAIARRHGAHRQYLPAKLFANRASPLSCALLCNSGSPLTGPGGDHEGVLDLDERRDIPSLDETVRASLYESGIVTEEEFGSRPRSELVSDANVLRSLAFEDRDPARQSALLDRLGLDGYVSVVERQR